MAGRTIFLPSFCSFDGLRHYIIGHRKNLSCCLIKKTEGNFFLFFVTNTGFLCLISTAPLSRRNLQPREQGTGGEASFGKGAALMALALTLVLVIPLLAAFLTTPRYPVPAEDIQVSQVCQLEDGTVVFHLYIDDGLVLERLTFDTVETQEGSSLYYIPLHPILKTKRTDDKGFCNIYTSFRMVDPLKSSDPGKGDLDVPDWIKSVYVGSPGDGVLPASKTTEAEVGPIVSPP